MITNLIINFSVPVAWLLLAIMARKRNKEKGFYALLTLLFFLFYFRYVDIETSYYEPSTRNFTLRKLLERDNYDYELFRLETNNEMFILAVPNLKDYEFFTRLAALTTTPPMYVFNAEEVFLDWTNNLDDDQEFYNHWKLDTKQPLSIDEIRIN